MQSTGKSNSKQVGLQSGLEGWEGGGISDVFGELIPEGGGGHCKGSVAPGPALCLGGAEEASITGPEGA